MSATALMKPSTGLTVGDVLLLELPHVPEADREEIAWEFTGFPSWWDMQGDEWHPVQTFRRQLREFREANLEILEQSDASSVQEGT